MGRRNILRGSIPALLMAVSLVFFNPVLVLTIGELAGWVMVVLTIMLDSWET